MARQPTPAWFSRLDRLPPYHEVCVSEENAAAVLLEIFSMWNEPSTATEMHARWNEVGRFQRSVRQEFEGKDWTKESAHQVVEYLAAQAALFPAVATCLPEQYRAVLPAGTSEFIFSHLLMALGEDWVKEHPHDSLTSQAVLDDLPVHLHELSQADRGWLPLKRAIVNWEAATHVEKELHRRAQAHLGSSAGLLLLARGLQQSASLVPDLATDDLVKAALDRLRRSTYGGASQCIEKIFEHQRPNGDIERKQTLQTTLSGEIWKTVVTKWGMYEALDALARSLNGEMDIVAQAVVDDITNEVRHIFPEAAASYTTEASNEESPKRRRTFVNERALPDEEEVKENDSREGRSIKISIREVARERHRHEQEARDQRLALRHIPAFLAKYPEHADGIYLYRYDGPLTDQQLAKELGCTAPTIINRKKKAVEAFRKYLKIQDLP